MTLSPESLERVERLGRLLEESSFTVVLTGAGISTASGIPDFRTPGTGLWENADPAKVAALDAFREDARGFWRFYSQRLSRLGNVEPNPAHVALACLERSGRIHGVITQNIDRLHAKAGSSEVAEVHGSIDRAECLACGDDYPYDRVMSDLSAGIEVPCCDCGEALKPGVTLFGEGLPQEALRIAVGWARNAELLIVAGSSMRVWPVAGLPEMTLNSGGRLAVLNAEATPYDAEAVLVERSPLEDFLPVVADRLGCSQS